MAAIRVFCTVRAPPPASAPMPTMTTVPGIKSPINASDSATEMSMMAR